MHIVRYRLYTLRIPTRSLLHPQKTWLSVLLLIPVGSMGH